MSPSTDRDVFRELLDRAGVVYRAVQFPNGVDAIIIAAKAGPNNGGYMGFEAQFEFDTESGRLDRVEVWE